GGQGLLDGAGGLAQAADLVVVEPGPESVRAREQHVAAGEALAAGDAHARQRPVAAEAALDEVAHRMRTHLALADQPLAPQQLDVAVIARTLLHAPVAQLINPAVADV